MRSTVWLLAVAAGAVLFVSSASASVTSSGLTADHAAAAPVLHWQGPLMVSGDHPGSLFAHDPNDYSQAWGCAPGLCLIGDSDGDVYGSADPASGIWTRSPLPVAPLLGQVTCASASFCAGLVGDTDAIEVSSSTDPTKEWSRPVVLARGTPAVGIACPAAGECVVLTGTGELFWSDSATVASSWHHGVIAGARGEYSVALACVGTGLCFAQDSRGRTLVSTDPTGGPSAWSVVASPRAGENLPACASPQLCTFVSTTGQIYASTSPTQAGSWQPQFQEPSPPGMDPAVPGQLACTAPSRCVGESMDGRFLYSDDPAGGPGAWHEVGPVLGGSAVFADLSASSCASLDGCVVRTGDGRYHVLVDPADPGSWRTTSVTGRASRLDQLRCAGAALCLAVDARGGLQTSTAPLSGVPWTAVALAQPLADAVCGSVHLCAAVGRRGGLFVSGSPAGGRGAWHAVDAAGRIVQVACRGARFCVAVAADGRTYSSVDPLSPHGWRRHGPLRGFTGADRRSAAISCTSGRACAITAGDSVWSSRDPSAARPAWRQTVLPVALGALSLSCPSTALCLARTSSLSGRHDVLVGHAPFSSTPRWSAQAGAPGIVRCFGRGLCAEAIHLSGEARDAVLVNGSGGHGRWTVTFGSSVESDEPPYFVGLDDVACVPGRFCLIATDSGSIIAGRFGPGRCTVYGDNDIGCRAVKMTDRRLRAQAPNDAPGRWLSSTTGRADTVRGHVHAMKTYVAKPTDRERDWLVVDATGQTLGRLATQIADTLRGKRKPTYTPHIDTGDFVIVVNAEKISVTGNKIRDKRYYRHSGYPGGLKFRTLGEMLERRPEEVIRIAVKGMLPRNRLARKQLTKLKVYAGPEHPHAAQQPRPMEIAR